jgi:endonuclease YncB( thermonuclease family)
MIPPNLSWAWSGEVIGVTDGDTIIVVRKGKQVRIGLYGIDTPEKGQPFGKKANQFTVNLVLGKRISIERMARDKHGREQALIFVGKTLVNEELVKAGLAWVHWKYCHLPICESWKNLQLRAKIDKRGFWGEPEPVPPWEFRRKKRE